MSETIDQVVELVEKMSLLEVADLVKALEDKFGVSAAAPVAVAAAVGGADGGGAAEEQTEFDAVLTDVGAAKIKVIKEVRAITALGLKEAKALVESAPTPVKEGVSQDEANEIKEKIEAVGGTVEIK